MGDHTVISLYRIDEDIRELRDRVAELEKLHREVLARMAELEKRAEGRDSKGLRTQLFGEGL
jgi:hypothetical protein